jgi:hypothetical protein
MYYSWKELVESFGASKTTLQKRMVDAGIKKKTPGNLFSETEAKLIAQKLDFTLKSNEPVRRL